MTPGEHAVLNAHAYANSQQDHAGYWLRVRMVDGTELRGPCEKPGQGVMCMHVYEEDKGVNYAEPVWLVLDQVSSVQIEW